MRKKDISVEKKSQVGAMLIENKSSYADIAKIVGISKSIVVIIAKTVSEPSAFSLTFNNIIAI